jgi:hypothetical protein
MALTSDPLLANPATLAVDDRRQLQRDHRADLLSRLWVIHFSQVDSSRAGGRPRLSGLLRGAAVVVPG